MRRPEDLTYYELLRIARDAPADDVRPAYERVLAMPDAELAAVFEIEPTRVGALRARQLEAMEFLSDADLRQEYDRSLPPAQRAPEPSAAQATHRAAVLEVAQVAPPRPSPQPPSRTSAPVAANDEGPGSLARSAGIVVEVSSTQTARARPLELAPEMSQESAIGIAESALAQVSAKVRERPAAVVPVPAEPKAKPFEVHEDTEFNGEVLRQVRNTKGVSIAQLAERTRIAQRHIENIEADRYDALPATVYLRGILMSLARELGLDGLRVSKSYLGLVTKK